MVQIRQRQPIGKLMFGTTSVTPILRLPTVVEAAKHSDHFLKEVFCSCFIHFVIANVPWYTQKSSSD